MKYFCMACTTSVDLPEGKCPHCGGEEIGIGNPPHAGTSGRALAISIDEDVEMREGLDVEVRDVSRGNTLTRTVASRQGTTSDGEMDADLSDCDPRLRITGDLRDAFDKLRDERAAVEPLVPVLRQRRSRPYALQPKDEEDGDFPDFWLHCGGERLGLEVTHFDEDAIASLARDGSFQSEIQLSDLVVLVESAVARKQKYDRSTAGQCLLVVTCPYPVPPALRETVRDALSGVSSGIFQGIRMTPLDSKPLELGAR